jgi:hypothetical protein
VRVTRQMTNPVVYLKVVSTPPQQSSHFTVCSYTEVRAQIAITMRRIRPAVSSPVRDRYVRLLHTLTCRNPEPSPITIAKTGLSTLPDELLLDIMNYFRTNDCYRRYYPQDDQVERTSLLALSYTCKRFNSLAHQLLFHDVRIKTSWQEKQFIDNSARSRARKYLRYYRGSKQKFLRMLLSQRLDLHHLTIPPSTDPSTSAYEWIKQLHKDLIVREIRLMIGSWCDAEILRHVDRFKGLKTLCLDFDSDRTASSADMIDLFRFEFSCPELEHLALFYIFQVPPIHVDHFPKLKSLYIEIDPHFYDSEPVEHLWPDVFMELMENEVFFFVRCDQNIPFDRAFWHWWFHHLCWADTDSGLLDPTRLAQWFILSASFFAKYFEPTSDLETTVEVDLLQFQYDMIVPIDYLVGSLETLKSLESLQKSNRPIWLRIPVSSYHPLDRIISSMPTNVAVLDIQFSGDQPIPTSFITKMIPTFSQLYKLHIVIKGSNSDDGPITTDNYPRFTNSSFAGLFPFTSWDSDLSLTLSPGNQPRTTTFAPSELEENREFIAEVTGFFDLSSTLGEINLKFCRV